MSSTHGSINDTSYRIETECQMMSLSRQFDELKLNLGDMFSNMHDKFEQEFVGK